MLSMSIMARKNNPHSAEASGSIHFDARTRTVMAEASHENVKEKVQSVREVVPGKSNNEVVLVLQYYDYSVEKTIQAYLEDGAKVALQEWNFTGSKQPNKKRKNKKKANNEKATDKVIPTTSKTSVVENKENVANGEKTVPNGHLPLSSEASETESPLDSPVTPRPTETSASATVQNDTASSATSTTSLPQRQQHHNRGHGRGGGGDSHSHGHGSHSHSGHSGKQRERTTSEMSSSSGVGDGHKKPLHSLEKAFKDLQRQTTSLERLRLLLDSEIERSYKSVKNVFEELRSGLNKRESELLEEMDVLKKESYEMLETRQNKAAELKKQVDRSERMKESEITSLRSEIKHFVSDRRHDDELGRTTRFLYDSDHMMEEIDKFGEIVHVLKSKNAARRPSISSVASSSISHDDHQEDDLSHSKEVSELQDRLKSSLGLQDSAGRVSDVNQNGISDLESKPEDVGHYRTFVARSPSNRGKNANRAKSPQASSSPPSSQPRSADSYRGRGGRGGGPRGRGRGSGGQRGRGQGSPSASRPQGGIPGNSARGASNRS